jgi:hypothetical protein
MRDGIAASEEDYAGTEDFVVVNAVGKAHHTAKGVQRDVSVR